jgi:hypothetical protein
LSSVQPLLITELPKTEGRFRADLAKERSKAGTRLVNIQYKKPLKEIERARECLKQPGLAAGKVGDYTFEYFLKQECQ